MSKLAIVWAVALASLFACIASLADAEVTAKIPQFVFKDAQGDVMGKVVGFQKVGEFSIAMDDPNFANDVPISVTYNSGFQFAGPEGFIFYTGNDCSGEAWIQEAATGSRALSRALGRSYGVGPTPGGSDVIVYRGRNEVASTPAIKSRFSGGTCIDPSAILGGPLVRADPIIDITTDFPGPYSME